MSTSAITVFCVLALFFIGGDWRLHNASIAQASPTPTPTEFDQKAALAKLRNRSRARKKNLRRLSLKIFRQ